MKRSDFERHLKKNYCSKLREGSNHSIWINEANNKKTSLPHHNELSNIICKVICKQLEVPAPENY